MNYRRCMRVLSFGVTWLGLGCTWSRFDDILSNSPVQILDTPADTNAIGLSVSAMKGSASTTLFATATDAYVFYEFGDNDLKSSDAVRQGSCTASEGCWLANSSAPVAQTIDDEMRTCFAFAIESKAGESARALLACERNQVRGMALPEPTPGELAALGPNAARPQVNFASGPRLAPDLLVAASRASGAVWFYPAGSTSPVAVPKPAESGDSYGASVAVAGRGNERFIAVGDPESARVYILATDGNSQPSASLCIVGARHFSAALAAGAFTALDSPDLAVASDDAIVVLPALPSLPFSSDPTKPCLDLSAIESARAISCATLNGGNPCDGQFAGVALSTADLNGDGKEELLVGTPAASSRGNDAAGKVLVTSFAKDRPSFLDELSPSSAESGDRLGTSITGVPLSRPDVILAGAPGGNKLAAFFCTSLLAAGKGGARCD